MKVSVWYGKSIAPYALMYCQNPEKHNPKFVLSAVARFPSIEKPKPQLDELWDKYSEFKKLQVSPSTYAKDFTKHRNHIAK